MKQLITIAKERGMPYQMNKAELAASLGFTPEPVLTTRPVPMGTLPPAHGMPVRTLRLIVEGCGIKRSYRMNRTKLHEVLGLPKPESTDISVHKLRMIAKERGIPCPKAIRKADLFELLGIDRPPTVDLRVIRCESLRNQDRVCRITLIHVCGGQWRSFRSITVASKILGIGRATLSKMCVTGHTHKGWRVAQPEDQMSLKDVVRAVLAVK
jgi:hypothetical protein